MEEVAESDIPENFVLVGKFCDFFCSAVIPDNTGY
jgi:hypothetical protein